MSFNLNDVPYNIEDAVALEHELSAGSGGSGSPYPSIRSGGPTSPNAQVQVASGRVVRQGRVVSEPTAAEFQESLQTPSASSPATARIPQRDNSPSQSGGVMPSAETTAARWKAVRNKLDAKRTAPPNASNETLSTAADGGPRRRSQESDNLSNEQQQQLQQSFQRRRVSSMLTSPVISRQSHGTAAHSGRPLSAHSDVEFDVADPDSWTLDRVLRWLDANGFGQDWQDTFRRRQIDGQAFLGLTSYLNVRKVTPANVHAPDAGAKLCNAVRRLLEKADGAGRKEPDPLEAQPRPEPLATYGNPEAAKSSASLAPEIDLPVARSPAVRQSSPPVRSEAREADSVTGLKRSHRKSRSADLTSMVSSLASLASEDIQVKLTRSSPRQSRVSLSSSEHVEDSSIPPTPVRVHKSSASMRRLVQATSDGEWFATVDLSHLSSGSSCRQRLAEKLQLDASRVTICLTEIGCTEHDRALEDAELERHCHLADGKGSTKFRLFRLEPETAIENVGRPTVSRQRGSLDAGETLEDHAPQLITGPAHQPELNSAAIRPRSASAEFVSLKHEQEVRLSRLPSPETYRNADGFRVIRRTGEIDFDRPRASPFNAGIVPKPDDSVSTAGSSEGATLQQSASLKAQRVAPRRPPGSVRSVETARINSLSRGGGNRRQPSTAVRRAVSSVEGGLRPGSMQSTSTEIGPPADEKTFESVSSGFSFDDAPALGMSDEESEEDQLWAVKPRTSTEPHSTTSEPRRPSGFKYQSMKKPKGYQAARFGERVARIEAAQPIEEDDRPQSSRPQDDAKRPGAQASMSRRDPAPDSTASASTITSPGGNSDMLKRSRSFARQDVWAVRPPADALYENLQDFFPHYDLDKPIAPADVRSPSAASPSDQKTTDAGIGEGPSALGSSMFQRRSKMKSIRVVAREANDARKRFRAVARGVQAANRLRRRSTKVWGQKVIEVTPRALARGEVELDDILSSDSPGPDGGRVKRTPTFRWIKGELIGKGTYGHVYIAMNAQTGEMLAVKQVEVSARLFSGDVTQRDSVVNTLNSEIETMRDLDQINIVQYLGYERTEDRISIFLEYVPGGSVGGCLRKHGKFQETVIRSLTRQTLLGLQYIHNKNILHRDLKADNLLLDLDGTCKISDFGISKRSRDVYGNDANMSMQGTIFWMAPEVIQTKRQGYSAKIDIWSLGCVVLEMFAGRRPWSTEEAIAVLYTLGKGVPPPVPSDVEHELSAEAKDFLNQCFIIDPDARPTAEQLLSHPFAAEQPDFQFGDTKLGLTLKA